MSRSYKPAWPSVHINRVCPQTPHLMRISTGRGAGVLLIGCSEGGTSIEDLAEKYPEKIVRIPVDIREGITDEQARQHRRHQHL